MDNKYTNILYNSALTALGVVGIGFISRKALKESLGTPVTLQGTIKLGLVIGLSNILVNYIETMKYIPATIPIKKTNKWHKL